VRHGDQRANDRDELVIVGNSADETLVDLDMRQRHLGQKTQRSIAGAEVVEDNSDAELSQLAKRCERRRVAAESDIFGDLELEGVGRKSGVGENSLQLGDK
jgi:hypothetical protein